jgi:hypothetical protein
MRAGAGIGSASARKTSSSTEAPLTSPNEARTPEVYSARPRIEDWQNRDAGHVLPLLRQGAPLNPTSLARAAAVTVANEQVRLDGVQEQIAKLQVEPKFLDRTILKIALELHTFIAESRRRRGMPDLPPFKRWLGSLPCLEGRPHASVTAYLADPGP